MKINLNNDRLPREQTREGQGRTFIAPNLVKETVRLDQWGNEIDPRTKQVINPNKDKE